MSISLIITKSWDEDFNRTGDEISESEWEELIKNRDDLRFRLEPYHAVNPATNETIKIEAPEGAVDILVGEDWLPFLSYSRGELKMEFMREFEDPSDPLRKAVTEIAKGLSALITHDAGDEILKW